MKETIIAVTISALILVGMVVGLEMYQTRNDSKVWYDFREYTWGMTLDEVRASEANLNRPLEMLLEETENTLVYRVYIARQKAIMIYQFDEGRLSQVKYGFTSGDWKTLSLLLRQKYGEPDRSANPKVKHVDSSAKNTKSDKIYDYSTPTMVRDNYSEEWAKDGTLIQHFYTPNHYHIAIFSNQEYINNSIRNKLDLTVIYPVDDILQTMKRHK